MTVPPANFVHGRSRIHPRLSSVRGWRWLNLAQQNAIVVTGIHAAMTNRLVLEAARISPAAAEKLKSFHSDVVARVVSVVESHPIVVVGMAQNPHVKTVRNALKAAGLEFEYLEFGSYFSEWKQRLAIKQWSGWPTFPQVFVRGVLIGGAELTKAALADGSLQARAGTVTASPVTAEA